MRRMEAGCTKARGLIKAFPILQEAPTSSQRGTGPLHHPTSGQYREPPGPDPTV